MDTPGHYLNMGDASRPAKRVSIRPSAPLPFEEDPFLDSMYDAINGLVDLFDEQSRASNVIKRAWLRRAPKPTPKRPRIFFRVIS